jgi:quinol monooxygenase YgiN
MIIIAGYTLTAAEGRDAAVKAFAKLVDRARRYDGCLDCSITADSVDPERINVFELWRDRESLDAWRKRERAPKVDLRAVHVSLYRTDEAEDPFGRPARR